MWAPFKGEQLLSIPGFAAGFVFDLVEYAEPLHVKLRLMTELLLADMLPNAFDLLPSATELAKHFLAGLVDSFLAEVLLPTTELLLLEIKTSELSSVRVTEASSDELDDLLVGKTFLAETLDELLVGKPFLAEAWHEVGKLFLGATLDELLAGKPFLAEILVETGKAFLVATLDERLVGNAFLAETLDEVFLVTEMVQSEESDSFSFWPVI